MNANEIQISQAHVHKLLCAKSPDAALLYLYINSGNDPENARKDMALTESRYACAAAILRQMGLWVEKKTVIFSGERPQYSERDVLSAMDEDKSFRSIYGEVQRVLGRTLSTEDLKILLGFTNYLGLPAEVISLLVNYCKERAREKGSLRNPSLRSIEKEAYYWAEQGIDSMEEAAAFIQNQNMRRSQLSKLMNTLQIRGRNLTPGEEKYAASWMDMGFAEDVIALAYERTCLNTGGLSWAYMNKILTSWQQAGLLTLEQVQKKDKKSTPKGASGELGQAEMDAIAKLLRENG